MNAACLFEVAKLAYSPALRFYFYALFKPVSAKIYKMKLAEPQDDKLLALDNPVEKKGEKKERTKDDLKKEEEMENLGKEFTGEGFMSYDELVKIIKAYQQRHFAEDVDCLEKLGGKLL